MMRSEIRELTKTGGSRFYIYTHARPDGSIFYVGKGVGDRARDFAQRTEHHKRIVAKHGRKNIILGVYPAHDEVHAYAVERQLILAMRKAGIDLCNRDDGGNGRIGVRIGDEQRKKISAALMGHVVSQETRERMRAQRLGKTSSAAARAKRAAQDMSLQVEAMRLANLGRDPSAETRAKISQANTGRKLTPEHRAKLSAIKRGVKHSAEAVAKRAASLKATWAIRKAKGEQA